MVADFKSKISLEKFYRNRTYTYILPIIREFGEEFMKNFRNLQPVVYTIGDMAHDPKYLDNTYLYVTCTMNSSFVYGKNVFDKEVYDNFRKFIDNVKGFPCYVTEYVQGDPKNNNYTVVLNYSSDHSDVKRCFHEGRYSDMYSRDTLKRLIPQYVTTIDGMETMTKSYAVLAKDSRYIPAFKHQLYRDFGTKLDIDDDREYDYKPPMKQEVLNYDITVDPYLVNKCQ